MRRFLPWVLAVLPVFLTPARADNLVNNRSLDAVGDAQYAPRVALVNYSLNLLCLWEHQNFAGTVREIRIGVSGYPHGTYSWVMHGTPPAPAGYQWLGDMRLAGPPEYSNPGGPFLLVGQVRTVAGPPYTIGMASVRGLVVNQNTINWETPQLIETFGSQSLATVRIIGGLTLSCSRYYPAAYLGYTNVLPNTPYKATWFRRSFDFGTTWSAPIYSGADSTDYATVPTFQCGTNSFDVTMVWGEPSGSALVQKARTSQNQTTSFGPVQALGQVPNSQVSSPFGVRNTVGQLATTCDNDGPNFGSVYLAQGEEMAHGSITFPDPATSPSQVEIEPNNLPAQATPVAPGAVIRGVTSGAPPDTDDYAFSLSAGQAVMMLPDSGFVGTEIRGPDGVSVLSRFSIQGEFAAPAAGTYLLMVTRTSGGPVAYRIRTLTTAPPAGGSRDQRDMFLSRMQPGVWTWSAPVNVSALDAPVGYDEDGVTLATNKDGYLHLGSYDWTSQPGKEIARYGVHRSIDGGQTWEGPAFVSSTATDMSLVLTPPIPAVRFGPWQDLAADGRSLYYVWVDGRNGDLDIYSRTIDRMMQITSVTPSTTSAYPNDVVHLQVGVQNLDDLWGWNLVLQAASSTPYWWNLEQSSGALGPSASATFDYAYTVPDTAAPEDVEVDVILRPSWQGGAYSVFPTTLHVLSLVGVEGEEARLDLPPVSPNPARRLANVTFSLSRRGIARLAVYDVAGRCVRVLQEGDLGAGRHARSWDGRDASGSPVASGAYLVRLEAEGRLLTKRMVWIR